MNSFSNSRPLISEVPAEHQMAFASFLQSRQAGWGTAAQWLEARLANMGQAGKWSTLSKGTTRHDPQPAPVVERVAEPYQPPVPVSVQDLGTRPVSYVMPRHGVPLADEVLNSHGEPTTQSPTKREDF